MEWTGGCLCGAVRFRATAEPTRAVSCHCGICRRHSGAAFLTFVHFPVKAFTWLEGEPTRYQVGKGVRIDYATVELKRAHATGETSTTIVLSIRIEA